MTYQIWRYPLKVTAIQHLSMPPGAELLSVDNQQGTLTLWARVIVSYESPHPMEQITIGVFGTSHDLPEDVNVAQFIGTVLIFDGQLIWHVFRMQ